MSVNLTTAERRAAALALEAWLATYAQGARPESYVAAERALRVLKEDDNGDKR